MNDNYEKISPLTDLEIHTQAIQDFQDAVKVSRGMKNGKATTPWGIPSEIWKIILNPNKVFTKLKYGIGHKRKCTIPTKVWKFLIGTLCTQKHKKNNYSKNMQHVLLNLQKKSFGHISAATIGSDVRRIHAFDS